MLKNDISPASVLYVFLVIKPHTLYEDALTYVRTVDGCAEDSADA